VCRVESSSCSPYYGGATRRTQALLAVLLGILLLSGCGTSDTSETGNPSALNPLPENAELLFLSSRGSSEFRFEIYAREPDGTVTRITTSDQQHHIFGIDGSRRYIVATRGPEDRKRVWLLDLESGTETPLTGENVSEYRTHIRGRFPDRIPQRRQFPGPVPGVGEIAFLKPVNQ
jgi:hypothetical protein